MDRYVSPSGLPTNPGTKEAAWSLADVLADGVNKYAQPGDTVYLLPGTYRWPIRKAGEQGFRFRCKGAPDKPIVFRPLSRFERVTIDGGLWSISHNGSVLDLPKHLRFVGLEFLVSENLTESRDVGIATGSASYSQLNRPNGTCNVTSGHDIRVINCLAHHCSGGMGIGHSATGGNELYGNIIYENGWLAMDRKHGHGIYSQNNGPDWQTIRENLVFDNYSFQIHCYGSSAARIDYFDVSKNCCWSTGISGDGRLLVGGDVPSKSVHVNGNIGRNCGIQLGYTQGGDDAELIDNVSWYYFVRMTPGWTNATVRNNLAWSNLNPFPLLDSVRIPTPPSTAWLWPNAYDADRASLIIHNYQNAASIDVPFAGLADIGDQVSLYDPRDFFGPPKHVFEVTGPTITVPLDGPHAVYVAIADRDPCRAVKQEAKELRRLLGLEQAARAADLIRIVELENNAANNAAIFQRVNEERALLAADIAAIRQIVNR